MSCRILFILLNGIPRPFEIIFVRSGLNVIVSIIFILEQKYYEYTTKFLKILSLARWGDF